jgi:ankyrin repeat protein
MFSEWQYRPGRESEWGPPGLETPAPEPGANRLLAPGAAVCLLAVLGVSCWQHIGSIGLRHGVRQCPDAPPEIEAWALDSPNRRPEDGIDLQQWIAQHPSDINTKYGGFCDTPLHYAARFGREDLARSIIAAGADIEAPDGLNDRPLHAAATYGHPTVVEVLLARGADVNSNGMGTRTPLHCAVLGSGDQSNAEGRIHVAKLLLAAGADVNAPVPPGRFTSLRYATSGETGNAAMAELLLSSGADPRGAEEDER